MICLKTWHRLFIPATEVSQTLLLTFWQEWRLIVFYDTKPSINMEFEMEGEAEVKQLTLF